MDVRVFNNYDEISSYAAKEIISLVKKNPVSVLGLATGSSPVGVYKEIIKDHINNKTSYKNIKTFNLDEYYGINRNHSQSYYHFMKTNLFQYIDLADSNINIPNGASSDIEAECKNYNERLKGNTIDIQILGIGRNGHIGFNEPGTSFDSVTHQVKLDDKTRFDNARFFDSINEVPTHAVTMGIKNILAAKKIILIATGLSKAQAIHDMVKGPLSENCPASSLQLHNNVIVLIDKEAATNL